MTAWAQINIRAPEEAREVLLRVGTLIRNDPAFIHSLQRFLDGQGDDGLAERLAKIEARLAAVEAR
ncbi:hypothetical protein [Gemmobacter serpentinus]|uniref:hypothetical protein n=1 Tax=Gemmobacter serpentinus TaxID=2652247 RepID=UPI00124C61F5|nr:hypothetical protein [Gemmobacter serpentinus]